MPIKRGVEVTFGTVNGITHNGIVSDISYIGDEIEFKIKGDPNTYCINIKTREITVDVEPKYEIGDIVRFRDPTSSSDYIIDGIICKINYNKEDVTYTICDLLGESSYMINEFEIKRKCDTQYDPFDFPGDDELHLDTDLYFKSGMVVSVIISNKIIIGKIVDARIYIDEYSGVEYFQYLISNLGDTYSYGYVNCDRIVAGEYYKKDN